MVVKPVRPSITRDVNNPTEGDDIVLTCSSITSGVTAYEFKRGPMKLVKSSSATYKISNAQIGKDDGSYTCIAYIGAKYSAASQPTVISGE